ncbi:MAG: SUMF1/EgtB/PvdO family nonheme iron enzyme, partial [Bacteroidales bacterium]|nr:SUMF1/EgtB/PvdO family nonheme iron enzyme [Bacteroidales bacterium]
QTHSYDTLHAYIYDTVFNHTYDTVFTHIEGMVDTNYVDSLLSHSGFLTDYTESQILTISNDTIYLTGGSFVKLPAGFSGDYNDLSNKPTIPTNVSELTNDAGYLTTETPQVISISHDTIFLSNGGLAILPPSFSGDYNDLTNKPLIPTNVSDLTNDAGYITSFSESQILSIGHDTIYLTGGSFVKLPAGFSGNYDDLVNKPIIPTVPDNVSAFTNDAGYLTNYTETQALADVVANSNSAGHSQIKDVNDPTDSKDAVNLQFLMAQLALLQNQLDSLSQMIPQPAVLPTITTASVSAITDTSATCGGSVTSSDGATVFAKGVCWSTSPTPTISDSYTSDGIGDGSFASSITGLTAGTTYYVRAYAINTAGTAYGQQVTFTTRLNDEDITVNGYTFKMKYVEGGTFNMGAQSSNSGGANYDPSATTGEAPVHSVTLRSFYMGETEVTQGLWEAVMGSGSSSHGTWSSTNGLGANYPAYNISYSEVLAFVTQLNTLTGRNFRMPTEAEWEYAARGGSQSQGYKYSGGNTIGNVAWYNGNSFVIHTVKEKTPNELGIYDMSGNVWEWCRDWRGNYSSASQTNPTGPASGSLRVVRGGNVTTPASNCRVSYRTNADPTGSGYLYGGFRLVMDTFSTNLDVTVNGYTFRMKYVEGGTFNMGAQSTSSSASNFDSNAEPDEKPVHSVTLSSFYMGETEVTQGLWDAVMGQGSSSHGDWSATSGLGANYPAYNISYSDVQTFVTQLNALTGRNFRVPTEAEWEYAARGGGQSQGYKYSGGNTIGNVAWYSSNSSSVIHTVKGKTPNELGIYDMSGNVWEWCSDWRGNYSAGSQTNPTGPDSGTQRRARGGCAVNTADKCRVSTRFYSNPSNRTGSMGFRLVTDTLGQVAPPSAVLPTVTTSSVSNNEDGNNATCGGNVTFTGGAEVTAKGVCWSLSPNPTISDSHTTNGTGAGSFTSTLTGLTDGTTYYVRAYATNSAGTAYGSQVCFSTPVAITVGGYTFKMKYVEGGTFNMGAQSANSSGVNYDEDAAGRESPVHSVTLSSFYMGETEVTQGLWNAVMGSGSSSHGTWSETYGLGANYPAYCISYNDVRTFVTQLNTLTGRNFRMPTEAEWEYAARGGSQSQGYKYSGGNTIGNVAWYNGNSGSKTHPVKGKSSNELGLYDMSGNVWEWCSDWYGNYSSGSQTDPTGPSSGGLRVVRGGQFTNAAEDCRVSYRIPASSGSRTQGDGFRLVMDTLGQVRPPVISAPTVTTSSVSDITSHNASCGGNVTFSGGAEVTAKGVCWSLAPNPTISDNRTTSGNGEGSFTSTLIHLAGGTTYYVRAYATNSVGTAYGAQVSFTTPSPATNLDITVNDYTFRMKFVAGGTFNMGAQSTSSSGANYDADAYNDENPVHSVALSGFYIGETEVTQGLWDAVMGSSSSSHDEWSATYGLGANYPAYNISYYDMQTFITQLNALTGRNFRMPTEAEWEYAARGGNQSQGYKYSGSNTVGDVAWISSNSNGKTHPVKGKSPNELGIYDMSGNVWEFCRDWKGWYSSDFQVNPTGLDSGSNRVRRGGAWNSSNVNENRVSRRDGVVPYFRGNYIGARLVLTE